jgi:uncharacterized membrane protein YeaQ/YmgE (transglycosylase-associated protein family)
MGLIATIIVGAIVGWLASMIAKTNDQMGCLWNMAIGIIGAALGHWIASMAFDAEIAKFSLRGLLVGIGGAVLLIMILRGVGILKRDS